ncbi:MAG: alpha-2-macroglobulin, partial [Anaerolineae bacterium]|nr:alpha-2-macroglobulin [Anaerolineae bacterium]
RYEVPETVGTGGMIDEPGTRTEAITLPHRFDVTQGELTVRVDPSLAATTLDGLRYLENYPYQCIEQTVSRFLPNVMTYRALFSLNVATADLRSNLEVQVSFALQRLYAQQHSDGGWGWFVSDQSNPMTTAYALIGLAEARNSSFSVSDEVILRAVAYLNGQMTVVNESTPDWRLNRQAFLLYALARVDRGNIARSMTLHQHYERLSLYARAYLAVTLNRMAVDMSAETTALANSLVSRAILSATGAHWEEDWNDWWNWNTDTRTTAIVLGALIELDPGNDLLAQAVRWLMVARTADHWETTQETAWAVMALTDWMVSTGELHPNYLMSATLNGERILQEQATTANVRDTVELQIAVADLLADQVNLLALTHGEGDGVMYYTAHLRAYLPVPEVEALDRGIILDRRYSLVDDPNRTPIDSAPVGTNVRVTLTIIAPNDLHYVVIEDPIPAGTDAVDPGLRTSSVVGTMPEVDRTDPLSHGWGWWYFSNTEFRDEKVVIFATYLPAGTYEYSYTIRTGLAGEYNVIPVTGQEFYFPEVYGRSDGTVFTITPEVE